jgi:hypothetical protein
MNDGKEEYTNRNAICPHCGFEDRDSGEFGNGLMEEQWGDIECGRCDRIFEWRRQITVFYVTRLPKTKLNKN